MNQNKVIEVSNVSKLYRLGKVGTSSLLDDIKRLANQLKGKKHSEFDSVIENNRESIGGEKVWALKDINFSVYKGDVLGIVGRNGAGKSTLLKILSGITSPTIGEIKINGRIASLLEVGTGFHPELTGRENIFLNGAILGMTKSEIKSNFDEIVDFSGVAKYIDTPVKRYSSGMRVRLGFAVAAYLNPEILIVDEVLAVGDAEFQKRAIGKMKEVSSNQGRTVLFVSHNMASLRKLCTKGILLSNGKIEYSGGINETIDQYFLGNSNRLITHGKVTWPNSEIAPGDSELRLLSLETLNEQGIHSDVFYSDQKIIVVISYKLLKSIRNFRMQLQIHSIDDTVLFTQSSHNIESIDKVEGTYTLKATLPANLFNTGEYKVFLQADIPNVKTFGLGSTYANFQFVKRNSSGTESTDVLKGYFSPEVVMEYL